MVDFINPLRELTILSVILRFLLSIFCGSLLGIERGIKHHEAGLRTHTLVCIGSAATMMLAQYLTLIYNSTSDPARLGAQVISGIGFLGAGTIIITGQQRGQRIKGLTTAAGLWACACIGLLIGGAFYEGAMIMFVAQFVVIALLNKLEEKFIKNTTFMSMYIEFSNEITFSKLMELLREHHWHLINFDNLKTCNDQVNSGIVVVQRTTSDVDKAEILSMLRELDGVIFVAET